MSEDSANQDELIVAQKAAIDKEIADTIDLISKNEEPISLLETEFANDAKFLEKARGLTGKYTGFRRTRPDGNCFYRAVAFRFFQILRKDKDELKHFKELVKPSKDEMVALGFPSFTIEDFYDTFMENLNKLETVEESELISMFNDQGNTLD